MEFKYRAVDNVKPSTPPPHSLSPATYLPDQSIQGFSGFRQPLTEALRREFEKEVIRREILRRRELEEEVRRELAMERELGISIQRPLNIHGIMSQQWSNSTVINPVVFSHIGLSQSPLIPINPSPEISDKDKVIVLARPDPELYNAKRKAATPVVSETEPSAFDLKKKPKQEWSCELCGIKATSESGLNAHLNGKKHKTKEAVQNRKICKSNKNKKSEKIVNVKATEPMDTVMVHKPINESKNEEQLVETVAETNINVTKLDYEKKLVETTVYKDVTECEKGEVLVEKSQCIDLLECNKEAATTEKTEKNIALTKGTKIERLWCEICEISTFSKAVMEGHIKGKKHIKKMKKLGQNNASPPSTSSIAQEAPRLIKDT